MKNLQLILSFFISVYSFGKDNNFIENGSFESTKGKLKGLGGIDIAEGWFSPTSAKADVLLMKIKFQKSLREQTNSVKKNQKMETNMQVLSHFHMGIKCREHTFQRK